MFLGNFMFQIEQIHNLAGKVIGVIAKQEETGVKNANALETALAEFSGTWNSEDCQRYMESFGKLALVAQTERGESRKENHEFNAYKEILQCAGMIDVFYRTRQFNHPSLFNYLAGVHAYTDLMKHSEPVIDASFTTSTS